MTRRAEVITDAELKSRAADLARLPADDEQSRGEQTGLLIVRLGAERFGIDVSVVREVVADPVLTALPMAPEFVAGLINLRGEILGVLELATMLALEPVPRQKQFAIVMHRDDIDAAVLADEVDEVAWFGTASREPLIPTVPAGGARFLNGAFRLGPQLITEININEVLNHPELQPLAERQG